MKMKNENKKVIAKILNRCLMLVLMFFAFWAYGLNSFIKEIPAKVIDSESKTDAIVVLTGGSRRFDESLKLLYAEKAKKLFVSGVGVDTDLNSMLLLSAYVPKNIAELAKNIELGYDAQNTKGNAEEVAKWVEKNNIKSIRLVTGNYHLKRSILEFNKIMPDIKIIPHAVTPEQFSLDRWWASSSMKKLLVTEYNKYLVAKLGFSV